VAVCGRNEKNGYSTGNYQVMDDKSTGGRVNLPGITISWTMNLQDELDSSENYQLMGADLYQQD
jgi:hypothetical protein